jgi:antitoxin component YwqK of YwqJK toxin-antitoxin module
MERSRILLPALGMTLIVACLLFAATDSLAQRFTVQGACRDGDAHGAWQLTDTNGRLRVLGAFNRGKRTGSFIYWNASGVRIAHMPYEEDARNGTLALWYQTPTKGLDAPQRLEAVYSGGQLNGLVRIWNPDGRVRGEYVYAGGRLVGATAWDARGRELSESQAREQAERDVAAHEAYNVTLETLVARHPPACNSAGSAKPG